MHTDVLICLQHRCTGNHSWTTVQSSVTSATVCGYSPYQGVQCDVKAYNGAGDSQTAISTPVRTDCEGRWITYTRILCWMELLSLT